MARGVLAIALLLVGCGPGLEEGLPPPDLAGDVKVAVDGGQLDGSVADAAAPPDHASGPDQWACREFFDSNYGHVDKGRATICGGNACAFGSGENLGLYNLIQKTWLREVKKGYFEAGRCP